MKHYLGIGEYQHYRVFVPFPWSSILLLLPLLLSYLLVIAIIINIHQYCLILYYYHYYHCNYYYCHHYCHYWYHYHSYYYRCYYHHYYFHYFSHHYHHWCHCYHYHHLVIIIRHNAASNNICIYLMSLYLNKNCSYKMFRLCSVIFCYKPWTSGPRLNIKTVLSMYGDFHVKDKTAVRTSYL